VSPEDVTTKRRRRPSRRADAKRCAALARARTEIDATEAQHLIEQFIAEAIHRGILPEPLRAQLSDGGTARTDKKGWYIKVNETVGIGEDGGYYVLSLPGGLKERLSGIRLEPSQPCLRVAQVEQDGEAGDLADFLTKRLRATHPEGSPSSRTS